jgi:hypothetical protein
VGLAVGQRSTAACETRPREQEVIHAGKVLVEVRADGVGETPRTRGRLMVKAFVSTIIQRGVYWGKPRRVIASNQRQV